MDYLRTKPTRWRWEDDGESRYITFVSRKGMGIQLFNPVASLIYSSCDGNHTETDVVRVLQQKYPKVAPEQLQNDVSQFLSFLAKADLIEKCESGDANQEP